MLDNLFEAACLVLRISLPMLLPMLFVAYKLEALKKQVAPKREPSRHPLINKQSVHYRDVARCPYDNRQAGCQCGHCSYCPPECLGACAFARNRE